MRNLRRGDNVRRNEDGTVSLLESMAGYFGVVTEISDNGIARVFRGGTENWYVIKVPYENYKEGKPIFR